MSWPRWRCAAAVFASLCFIVSCGESSDPGPTNPSTRLSIATVSPPSGPTLGGTAVVITGSGFAAGAVVAFGGAPASAVTVNGADSLTAVTPQHALGAVDVTVSVAGSNAVLPRAFTYLAPASQPNSPPRVAAMRFENRSRSTPQGVANIGDVLDLQASIEDDETNVRDLQVAWTASLGSIVPSGAAAAWTAPSAVGQRQSVRIEVTVTENYSGIDSQGLPVPLQHRVALAQEIAVHDLVRELVDLGYLFLEDFSQQKLDPDAVVRNFSDSCRGKAEERADVVKNHREEIITEYSIGRSPSVTISPGSVCPYYSPERQRVGDGCAWFPVIWRSALKEDASRIYQEGFDQVNAVFENGNWRLCDSDWKATVRTRNGLPTRRQFRK